MVRVGVRELRQHASSLLARVEAGEVIEISNHGRPVARLTPIDGSGASREELVRSGVLRPGHGDVLDVEPVVPGPGSPSTAELLAELRDER